MYTNRNPPLNKRLKERRWSDAGVGVLSHCCPVRGLYCRAYKNYAHFPLTKCAHHHHRNDWKQQSIHPGVTYGLSSTCRARCCGSSPIYNGWSSHKRGLFHSLNWFFFRIVRKMSRGCDSGSLCIHISSSFLYFSRVFNSTI